MNPSISDRFVDAARFLAKVRRPLLLSHEKPDGDALGSLVGMRSMLRSRGVESDALIFDEVPERYGAVFRGDVFVRLAGPNTALLASCDAVVILDTSTYSQLRPVAEWLRESRVPKLVFDHHQTREEIADCRVIDTPAAATCLILHEFATATGWALDAEALDALFVGIATDTGWFRYSNTDARALGVAAELVGRGVRAFELFQSLYQRDSAARLKLMGAALATLDLYESALAVITLDRAAFARTGASYADTEDMVNEPLRITTVVVSLLFVEQEDGVVRVNFRSKPPSGGAGALTPDVDVAALAANFGGGGHRRAAGARIRSSLADAKAQVIAGALQAIADAKSVR